MEPRDIYVTHDDLKQLKELIQAQMQATSRDRDALGMLRGELDRAHTVEPTAIPPVVVTMNSRVRLTDIESNETLVYTVVFPSEANVADHKISVLAPIGTALLGYRVGDTVEWPVPSGMRRFRIDRILYQPEAAGAVAAGNPSREGIELNDGQIATVRFE